MTYDGASHKRKIQQEYKLILKCLAGQRAMTLFILSLLLAAYGLVCYEAGWHHKGKQVEDIVLNSQYHFQNDPQLLGRKASDFPLKRCCEADGCLVQGRQPRHAVITYIRTDAYLPLLQQLECTVRKSNPWVELGVMLVRGELSEGVLAKVQALNFTINYVEPLSYPNKYKSRFTYNWLKVRAFGLTDYDAILLLDSDTVVIGGIQPLFSLPTDFAASWNQWPWQRHKVLLKGINAGVLFIRPCRATEQQMLEILTHDPKFRFEHGAAEQDFFDWYFHYTVMVLPLEWNVMASFSMEGGLTLGGVVPRIVHFTEEKPFNGPISNAAGHEYLCQLNA